MASSHDFFICCSEVDLAWADWIEWHLKRAGLNVWNPGRDIYAGNNKVVAIQQALQQAFNDASIQEIKRRMIVVLSKSFTGKSVQQTIWTKIAGQDPDGSKGLLIPLIVEKNISIDYFPNEIKPINLIEVADEEEASTILLSGINQDRPEIKTKPNYPHSLGTRPSYPLASSTTDSTSTVDDRVIYKLGQLDRRKHYEHFERVIPLKARFNSKHQRGFIIYGPRTEWPESISHRLQYFLVAEKITINKQIPDLKIYDKEKGIRKGHEQFLWNFLGEVFGVEENDTSEIKKRLAEADSSYIFSRKVGQSELEAHEFLVGLISTWQKIKLKSPAPAHFLLLICQSDHIGETSLTESYLNETTLWQNKIRELLDKEKMIDALLPPLSFLKPSDVASWLDSHFEGNQEKPLRNKFNQLYENKFSERTAIPLLELQKAFSENTPS